MYSIYKRDQEDQRRKNEETTRADTEKARD